MAYRHTAIYFFLGAVLAMSVIDLTFLPMAQLFEVFTLPPLLLLPP
jgi:hypothetical protein